MCVNKINNKAGHEQALAKLLKLMDQNPDAGSPEAINLDRLATMVEHYEAATFPIDLPSPEDARRFREEQMEEENSAS